MKTPMLALLALGFVFVSTLRINAQTPAAPPAQVEVNTVKFSFARIGSDAWLETDIRLDVKPGGKLVSGEFVDRVKVTLSIGCEASDSKGQKRLVFYRGNMELISLEGGKPGMVRFYLPPEVVKRDNLRADVKYYVIEVEAKGELQKPVKASAATEFTTPDSLKNFLNKVSSESGANEGILMPQYLTPFAADSQRPSATPLRRELQR
ncbi:MAG: hypothetical protein NTU80_00880 [Verrucomicrobia bacterium]|nr:hypothetical protein [Verrucomicrobiota bacterium]